MLLKRFLIWLLLAVVIFPAVSAQAQVQNLLQDPGMENVDYRLVSTDPSDPATTFNVPAGWGGGLVAPPGPDAWRNAHPTGFPHTAGFKIEGGRSFHMARGGGTFTAWLYQQVAVAPGTEVDGGAYAFMENNGGGVMRVGIDPTGGTNPFSPAVIWSPFSHVRYQWTAMNVRARIDSGTATLFLFATQDTPSNPNGVYWDAAFLNGVPGTVAAAPVVQQPPAPTDRFITANVRLRVRSGPGVSFEQIGSLNRGDSFNIVREENGWYGIAFNGQTGYVAGDFVTVSSGQPPASGGESSVSIDFTVGYTLRLRAAPDENSETLARIPYTTIVQAIGRSANSEWLQVQYAGQVGWVAARFGRLNGSFNSLPVR